MKKYYNYVLSFSDGSVKVGVTSRPETRVLEICRMKRHAAKLVRGVYTPLCEKLEAFQIEANLCALFAYRANKGTREWFQGEANEYSFFRQATGMFWHSSCNKDSQKKLIYTEFFA